MQQHNTEHLYKNLQDAGQLTNATLRQNSVTRQAHLKFVQKYTEFFDKSSNRTAPGAFEHIDVVDLFCDSEVYPLGTAETIYYIDKIHLQVKRVL